MTRETRRQLVLIDFPAAEERFHEGEGHERVIGVAPRSIRQRSSMKKPSQVIDVKKAFSEGVSERQARDRRAGASEPIRRALRHRFSFQ
jgi:hypothetical protein